MEAGLMEIVRTLNRSWICDAYFILYRPVHLGKSPGEMSEYHRLGLAGRPFSDCIFPILIKIIIVVITIHMHV